MPQRAAVAAWAPLRVQDVVQAACRQRGKAAGVDQWRGSEVASVPASAFENFAEFMACCERNGLVPSQWANLRQIHIPKPGKKVRGDGAKDVAGLRPIAISSVWYRVWAAAGIHSEPAVAWFSSWVPSQACGGVKGKDVRTALGPLIQAARQGKYLVSLDFSLAFDHCCPTTTVWLFQRLGLFLGIGQMLLGAWTNQTRYIEYDGCILQTPEKVRHSLPQGDAWSLYGLIALLTPPTINVQNSYPNTIRKTYVDDCSWVSNSCAEALAVERTWQHWANLLG